MTPEEQAEFSATRKVVAMCLKRLAELEKKVDYVTASNEQWEEKKRWRRERCWS
jgi:hypothetical protein